MFTKARLKLTGWYLVIIMTVSIAFSMFIYIGATSELDRVLRLERYRLDHPDWRLRILQGTDFQIQTTTPLYDPDVIEEAKLRIFGSLVGVNVVILLFSSVAGYFLAGRTLRPIKDMIDEQNRFVTDASHELNTPLTSLRTTLEVNLRDKMLTLPKARKVLESNLEDISTLESLSKGLIELTKYQKPNGGIHMEKMLVASLIQSAKEKVYKLAEKKQITFHIKTQKVEVLGDQKSLIELFTILLDNGIKYSNKKTVITIVTQKEGDDVIITIADQGIGIPQEDLPHIFERFYRADKSRTKQHVVGYGLGLSIAKRIVTLHGGTIGITSTIGKGTTVKIVLPIA